MTVRLPDVPRMADPGLSELLQAMRREMIALDARNAALEQAAGAAAGVNISGRQYTAYVLMTTATFTMTAAQAGALVQFSGAGGIPVTATLPPVRTMPVGSTITIWAGGGTGTLKAAGADIIYPGPGGVSFTTTPIVPGDVAELMSFGTAWLIVDGSLHRYPTPPQFNESGLLATTAWVKREGHQFSNIVGFGASTTLTAAHAGMRLPLFSANGVFTLPPSASIPIGSTFNFMSTGPGNIVQGQGSDTILVNGGAVASLTLGPGDTLELISSGNAGVNGWYATGGSVQLGYSWAFQKLNGGQRLPSGLIINWGFGQTLTGSIATMTLAIPFLSACQTAIATVHVGGGTGYLVTEPGLTSIKVQSSVVNTNFTYVALGI